MIPITQKKVSRSITNHDQMKKLVAKKYNDATATEEKRKQLVEDYLPLVKSVVLRMKHNYPDHYSIDDMYAVGAKALVVSVNQFDSTKGKSFGNYASLRIKGALLDELRRLDYLPRANRAKAKSLQQTILLLEKKLKRSPSSEEIRNELSLSDVQYSALLRDTQPVIFVPIESSKDGTFDGDNISLLETLDEPTEQTSAEQLESKEKVELLKDLIKNLPTQEKKILMLYYYEELRLSEIAKIFSLTEGRISQILSQSILSLKAKFKSIN
tara:strand:- start:94 stop:900 length:807 start_codon:yes stop_codon:yes gene_type:complete